MGSKVNIEEAQDLRLLSLDDLLGKLTTHELTLHDDEEGDVILRQLQTRLSQNYYFNN